MTPETREGKARARLERAAKQRETVIAEADAYVEKVVRDARAAGLPWSVIGEALRMSKQAAWERYGRGEQ